MHSIYGVAKWSQAYESTYWQSNDTYTMFRLFRSKFTPYIRSRLTCLISYGLTSHVRIRELWDDLPKSRLNSLIKSQERETQ